MKMTPLLMIFGSLLVFWAAVTIAIVLPAWTLDDKPSDQWREWSADERAGHTLYINNGCSYCHSQYIRTMDWDIGATRIAQKGDYYGMTPIILGTERTGPDLSQEGGEHPDDWQITHFFNPRYTRPMSLMPSWEFMGEGDVRKLTAYVQALGGKNADGRVARQQLWARQTVAAFGAGPEQNIRWLHDHVPPPWRPMPNPYPPTDAAMARGKKIYQQFCVNCHGLMGDGAGPAATYMMPPPLNFTELRGRLIEGKYIGGVFYYQIMNGITGTGMPYFKKDLESEKIWDVSNYVALSFLGYTDAGIEPRGIEASYEPNWVNTYPPPTTQGAPK